MRELVFAVLAAALPAQESASRPFAGVSEPVRGAILLWGGGVPSDAVVRLFVELAGKGRGRLVVIAGAGNDDATPVAP